MLTRFVIYLITWVRQMTLAERAAPCVLFLAATTLVTACQSSSLPDREPAQGASAAEKSLQQDSRTVPYVLQTGDELEVNFFTIMSSIRP